MSGRRFDLFRDDLKMWKRISRSVDGTKISKLLRFNFDSEEKKTVFIISASRKEMIQRHLVFATNSRTREINKKLVGFHLFKVESVVCFNLHEDDETTTTIDINDDNDDNDIDDNGNGNNGTISYRDFS